MLKNKRGITLIALVVTIIILLILAGVTINMIMGDDGILNKTKIAAQKYQNAANDEQAMVNEVANYINGDYVVGNRDTVTLTADQYNELISRIENLEKTVQPTGFSGAYLEDKCNGAVSADININSKTKDVTTNASTSTDGFFRLNTEGNISTYLSYSADDGYTVLKEGWYIFGMQAEVRSNTTAQAQTHLNLIIDGVNWANSVAFSNNDVVDASNNIFTLYLKKNSKFYFEIRGNSNEANYRRGTVFVAPMF